MSNIEVRSMRGQADKPGITAADIRRKFAETSTPRPHAITVQMTDREIEQLQTVLDREVGKGFQATPSGLLRACVQVLARENARLSHDDMLAKRERAEGHDAEDAPSLFSPGELLG